MTPALRLEAEAVELGAYGNHNVHGLPSNYFRGLTQTTGGGPAHGPGHQGAPDTGDTSLK